MVKNTVEVVVDQIDSVINLVKEETLQFNQNQCRHLGKALLQAREYLLIESIYEVCCQKVCSHLLKLIGCLVKRAEILVEECNKKDWLMKAVSRGVIKEDVNDIMFDLNWCLDIKYKHAQTRSEGTAKQDHDVQTLKKPTKLVPATEEEVVEDRKNLLDKLTRFVLRTTDEESRHLAEYLQGRLKALQDPNIIHNPTLEHIQWESGLSEPKEIEHLGSGSVGAVYKTFWLGVPCAKKIFKGCGENFKKEASTLAVLSHPNIVKFYCCFSQKKNQSILIELMDRSLFDLIEERKGDTNKSPFTLEVVFEILLQVAKGMSYLHENGVAHRDLKPRNILVTQLEGLSGTVGDGHSLLVKVADFEMVKLFDPMNSISEPLSRPNVGTGVWRAPEIMEINGLKLPKVKLKRADVFSFAMVFYEVLTGSEPCKDWKCTTHKEKYMKISQGLRPSLPQSCPRGLELLIEECWDAKPHCRPSFRAICLRLMELRSSWMLGDGTIARQPSESSKAPFYSRVAGNVYKSWRKILGKAPNQFGNSSQKVHQSNPQQNIHCQWQQKPLQSNNIQDIITLATNINGKDYILKDDGLVKRLDSNLERLQLKDIANFGRTLHKNVRLLGYTSTTSDSESSESSDEYMLGESSMFQRQEHGHTETERVKIPKTVRSGASKRIAGLYEEALIDLNMANDLAPNLAIVLSQRGATRRMLKDYIGALEDLNKANDLSPYDVFTLKERGQVKSLLQEYEGALADMNEVIDIAPDDVFILRQRGYVKKMLKDYVGALEDLNRASDLSPNDVSALKQRGQIKKALKDYVGALEDLNTMIASKPDDVEALRIRANLKIKLKDDIGAREDLDRVIKLDNLIKLSIAK